MAGLDEYGDPSEDMINDWNIHNDHQNDNEDIESEDELRCIDCDEPFTPNWDINSCDKCMADYWHRNPDPLDIAEREWREDQYPSLEDFYDYGV